MHGLSSYIHGISMGKDGDIMHSVLCRALFFLIFFLFVHCVECACLIIEHGTHVWPSYLTVLTQFLSSLTYSEMYKLLLLLCCLAGICVNSQTMFPYGNAAYPVFYTYMPYYYSVQPYYVPMQQTATQQAPSKTPTGRQYFAFVKRNWLIFLRRSILLNKKKILSLAKKNDRFDFDCTLYQTGVVTQGSQDASLSSQGVAAAQPLDLLSSKSPIVLLTQDAASSAVLKPLLPLTAATPLIEQPPANDFFSSASSSPVPPASPALTTVPISPTDPNQPIVVLPQTKSQHV